MPRKPKSTDRRICFVTGTRAEFGLMIPTLRAITQTPGLRLQLVATGMHLDPRHGDGLKRITAEGWKIDAIIPWPAASSALQNAAHTGTAMSALASAFARLRTDIVLVVGDRVEAFAAASAAHISGLIVAHVHGGDRALGQVDDALRHAITKLAHIHFPATARSAARIARLGEDRWRIHRAGSPGLDGIRAIATRSPDLAARYGVSRKQFSLVALHPTDTADAIEEQRAELLLTALRSTKVHPLLVIGPNNDPGSLGIRRAWKRARSTINFHPDIPRADFLGLLRDAAFLIGNSSSGIIEAASFHTPVIDVGNRQKGRERSSNVRHASFDPSSIRSAIAAVWRNGQPRPLKCHNVYGSGGASKRVSGILSTVTLDDRLRRKLIAY